MLAVSHLRAFKFFFLIPPSRRALKSLPDTCETETAGREEFPPRFRERTPRGVKCNRIPSIPPEIVSRSIGRGIFSPKTRTDLKIISFNLNQLNGNKFHKKKFDIANC